MRKGLKVSGKLFPRLFGDKPPLYLYRDQQMNPSTERPRAPAFSIPLAPNPLWSFWPLLCVETSPARSSQNIFEQEKKRYQRRAEAFDGTKASVHTKLLYITYNPFFGVRDGLRCLERKPRWEGDTWPESGHPSCVLDALPRALPAACLPGPGDTRGTRCCAC